jgi:hypothetical protein
MRAVNHAHPACPKIRENVVMREPSANHGFVPRSYAKQDFTLKRPR